MSIIKWSTASSYTTAVDGTTGSSGSLAGLVSTGQTFGNDFDNTSTNAGYLYADWDLGLNMTQASSAAPYVRVWLLRSADGSTTGYEAGSTTVTPARAPDLLFPCLLTSGQQKASLQCQPFPKCRFIPLLSNQTGYQCSSESTGQYLRFSAYREETV